MALVLACGAQGCAELPAVQAGVCGNGVVEAGEDCDSLASSNSCIPAGQANGCRFACERGSASRVCPSGWGCGFDGVCRVPTASFIAGPPLDTGEGLAAMGDLDGDQSADLIISGRGDLAGKRSVKVLHLDDTGAALQQVSIESISAPTVADFTGDGRADLIFAMGSGPEILAGQADRSLAPVLYPTISVERTNGSGAAIVPIRFRNYATNLLWCFDGKDVPGGRIGESLHVQQFCASFLEKFLSETGDADPKKQKEKRTQQVASYALLGEFAELEPIARLASVFWSKNDNKLLFRVDPRSNLEQPLGAVDPECQEEKSSSINNLEEAFAIPLDGVAGYDPGRIKDIGLSVAVGGASTKTWDGLCDRLFVPVLGTNKLLVVSPCKFDVSVDGEAKPSWRTSGTVAPGWPAPIQEISLPEGSSLQGRPLLVDINQDGFLDVLVAAGVPSQQAPRMFVSYGAFDGSFSSVVQPQGKEPDVTLAYSRDFQAAESALRFSTEGTISPNPGETPPVALARTKNECKKRGGVFAEKDGNFVCSEPFHEVLAAGDLSGDGIPDIVSPSGIWFGLPWFLQGEIAEDGQPAVVLRSHSAVYPTGISLWTEAVIEDLNLDGKPDVAAVPLNSNSIDVLLRADSFLFSPTKLSTTARLSQLHAADIDGDFVPDLVAKEKGPLPEDNEDELQEASSDPLALGDAVVVARGRVGNFPAEIERIGRPGVIDQLVLTRSIPEFSSGDFFDAISDIGVLARSVDNTQTRFLLMHGRSSGQLLAPFGLSSPTCNLIPFALQTALGHFDQGASASSPLDVAVLTGDSVDSELPRLRLWNILGAGQGNFGARSFSKASPGVTSLQIQEVLGKANLRGSEEQLLFVGGVTLSAKMATGDLDKDGLDEVVLLAPAVDEGQCGVVKPELKLNPITYFSPFCRSNLLVFKGATGGEGVNFSEQSRVALPFATLQPGRILVEDLDSDGFPDVLLRSGYPFDASLEVDLGAASGVNGRSELYVLWNNGGVLDTAPARLLPESSLVRDFALINLDSTPDKEIFVVSPDQSWVLRRSGRSFSAETLSPSSSAGAARGGGAVAVGDVDGDGLDDLAVQRGSQTQIFRVRPARLMPRSRASQARPLPPVATSRAR